MEDDSLMSPQQQGVDLSIHEYRHIAYAREGGAQYRPGLSSEEAAGKSPTLVGAF